MVNYIIKDVTAVSRYLPHGIVAGVVIVLLLSAINGRRLRQQKEPFSVVSMTALFMYLFIILCITFLSREVGSRNGIDMEFFSTWGINTRNNALVVENVLLFVPYGILFPWAFRRYRSLFSSLLLGIVTSLFIECLQLITARGYFQVDDILTNALGAVLGYFIFKVFYSMRRK